MAGEQQMHKAHMKIQLLVGTHEMSVQAQTPGVLICRSARLIGRTEKWVFAVEWQWLLPWQAVNSWKGHPVPCLHSASHRQVQTMAGAIYDC